MYEKWRKYLILFVYWSVFVLAERSFRNKYIKNFMSNFYTQRELSKYFKINRKIDNNCNILISFTSFCNGLPKSCRRNAKNMVCLPTFQQNWVARKRRYNGKLLSFEELINLQCNSHLWFQQGNLIPHWLNSETSRQQVLLFTLLGQQIMESLRLKEYQNNRTHVKKGYNQKDRTSANFYFFNLFWLGFTAFKVEQPLLGMQFQEMNKKKIKSMLRHCLERT